MQSTFMYRFEQGEVLECELPDAIERFPAIDGESHTIARFRELLLKQ